MESNLSVQEHDKDQYKDEEYDDGSNIDISEIMNARLTKKRLFKWQIIVTIALFTAFLFSFFCEDQIYLVEEDFKSYLDPNDSDNATKYFGYMLSIGYIFYLFGKLLWSFLTDTYIKSGVFPFGISLIIGPIISGIIGIINIKNINYRIPIIIILWGLHRMCQSAGFIGIVRIVSNWIEYTHHGRIMSIIGLGAFIGDSFVRFTIGIIQNYYPNIKWQLIVIFCSIITISIAIPMICLLTDSPKNRNLPMPKENEITNIYHNDNNNIDQIENLKLKNIFIPLLKEPFYYILIALSFFYALIAEMFSVYFAQYLSSDSGLGLSSSTASWISAIFPFMGIISTPLIGFYVDKTQFIPHWRLSIIPITALIISCCLFIITWFSILKINVNELLMVILVIIIGLSFWGCKALLAGVLSIDLGGHTSSAMICGSVDAFGSLGGFTISIISAYFKFKVMFAVATIVAVLIVITGIILFVYNKHKNVDNNNNNNNVNDNVIKYKQITP